MSTYEFNACPHCHCTSRLERKNGILLPCDWCWNIQMDKVDRDRALCGLGRYDPMAEWIAEKVAWGIRKLAEWHCK